MQAIIQVANRDGLTDLARELITHDITIFSTGSTLNILHNEKIPVAAVNELTRSSDPLQGSTEMMHPTLLTAILAHGSQRRYKKERHLHTIEPIDVVVANVRSFAELSRNSELPLAETIEQVDIGTLALIRAAASNMQNVLVLVRPQDYAEVLQEWREQGEVSQETRRQLAATAFAYLASNDSAVASYLRQSSGELFPDELTLSIQRIQPLRYGENPHQQAALYRWSDKNNQGGTTIAGAEVLQGKELSFNNLLDLDAALQTVQSFTAPTVAIIKQTNPCGLACDDQLVDAYRKAHAGDPISAFGGVIGCNRPVDEPMAQEIIQLFYEALIAPEYTPTALRLLQQRKDLRLLATHHPIEARTMNTQLLQKAQLHIRMVSGGLLLQTPDAIAEREMEYHVVTEREPTLDEVTDLMFAWKAVQHVTSNAIVLARKLTLVGVGAGQMNRASSVQLAIERAAERSRGAVLASDAFFPFADGIEMAARAGITAIIQPGGSVRDEETIRTANHYAIAMVFTGRRHFRH